MRFSARLAANQKQPLILEDAPRPLRIGYIKGILGDFVGETSGYRQQRDQPLETTDTHKKFIALIREESDPWDFDDQNSWGALTHHIKNCSWSEFYDFVELVGSLLIKADDAIPFDSTCHYSDYQAKVNALLQEDRIGWRLNDRSELHRQNPKAIAERIKSTESMITDGFAAARTHYQKAHQYLHQHPIDEANSIKEIVSAVESIAKTVDPKASTLGDAIKRARKAGRIPSQILDVLEKFYAYANGTPLVRHGHVQTKGPDLAEAELAFFIGIAFARYLIDTSPADA